MPQAAQDRFDPIIRSEMPELDTIRGTAILMVLLYHGYFWSGGLKGLTGIQKAFVEITRPGWLGVNLFFVLSGFLITGILLDSKSEATFGPIAPAAEMALMFADRAQSIAEIILPALDAGSIVLCDRYTDSSEAYQGGGRQLGSERILAMHAAACDNLQPDLTILLLPPLDISLRRARLRNRRAVERKGADENRFERESDDFYRRIYEKYEEIAAREPQRVIVIRDDATLDEIQTRIWSVVFSRLTVTTP